MKNIKLKPLLYFLLGVSLIFFTVVYKWQGHNQLNFAILISILPKVVTLNILFIGLFSSVLWKWKIFKGWLVPFPNLNGTWKGHIQSTWVDPVTGHRPGPIPAILTIHQSFFRISCVMRTGEMTSHCITAEFILDEHDQIKRLLYSYDSNPIATVKDRSPQHLGTMRFDIIEKPKRKLKGEYWTGRKTTGEIEMSFWKKEKHDSYPDNLGEHPVSSVRQSKG